MLEGNPVLIGVGIGAGFVLANTLVQVAVNSVVQAVNEWMAAKRWLAMGASDQQVVAHATRIGRGRTIHVACRRGCVICEDLGLMVRPEIVPMPVYPKGPEDTADTLPPSAPPPTS